MAAIKEWWLSNRQHSNSLYVWLLLSCLKRPTSENLSKVLTLWLNSLDKLFRRWLERVKKVSTTARPHSILMIDKFATMLSEKTNKWNISNCTSTVAARLHSILMIDISGKTNKYKMCPKVLPPRLPDHIPSWWLISLYVTMFSEKTKEWIIHQFKMI